MEVNTRLRDEFFKVIETQIKINDPPETKINFNRLINEGYSEFEAKQLLGQCIVLEVFRVMKYDEEFNNERYVTNMNNLPDEPKDKI